MKQILLLSLLTIVLKAEASTPKHKKDLPIFQRHVISFSVTNALSDAFYRDNSNMNYKPSYTIATSLKYSYGVSRLLRTEIGVMYLFQGQKPTNSGFITNVYTGSISVPVHLSLSKQLGPGSLTFTLGPSLVLPIHKYTIWDNVNIPIRSKKITENYPSNLTAKTQAWASISR